VKIADTTGAVYGQLAGAYYGERAIPSKWLSKLALNDLIIEMADKEQIVDKPRTILFI
jgi:ADP-ribosyl-[dinitrogen reductase] hydrolase